MASNTLWQQSEKLRTKKFPEWMEADFKVLTDFISKGEVETVGERDYRIPLQKDFWRPARALRPAVGRYGAVQSSTGNVMFQSFFSMRLNFEFDENADRGDREQNDCRPEPVPPVRCGRHQRIEFLRDKVIHSSTAPRSWQPPMRSRMAQASPFTR